jgi:large subunit ribosomal protein L17
MRHLKAGRKLNRNSSHRTALYRNLTLALIRHERIITTVAKAKAVRPFIEKLITLARKNDLHSRRLVLARLGPPSKSEVRPEGAEASKAKPPAADERQVIIKLFTEIAPRYADRPGGYLRILKRSQRRLGDAGETAFLEFVKPGDRPAKKKKAPAPLAPKPVAPVAPAPAPPPSETAKSDQPANPEPAAPEQATSSSTTGEAATGQSTPPENK